MTRSRGPLRCGSSACLIAVASDRPLMRCAAQSAEISAAAHAPDLLGIGLEEDAEETGAELVRHPFLEIAGVRDGEEAALEIGEHARHGLEDAELHQRVAGLERVVEQLAAVIDARLARTVAHVVAQELGPKPLDLARFGEEAVAADVEMEALIGRGLGDAADIDGIPLQHRHRHALLAEQVGGREAGRPGADADDGAREGGWHDAHP